MKRLYFACLILLFFLILKLLLPLAEIHRQEASEFLGLEEETLQAIGHSLEGRSRSEREHGAAR